MKESASIAISYIRANCDKFKIDSKIFDENDFHIHVPEGAIPKEGPSAGVALTTALLSSILSKKVKKSVAMTGEITLTGNVLEIGGVREKIIAAHRNNVKTVFLPKNNEKDLKEISVDVIKNIKFKFVKNYIEIFKELF